MPRVLGFGARSRTAARATLSRASWPVVVVPYDARWPARFEEERERLAAVFGERAIARTHHVHAVEHGGFEWDRHLRFRDHLRSDPEAARRYGERALAARHAEDRDGYTDAKAPFISAELERETVR